MHELSVALSIAELAVERAGDATPCHVVVEIGDDAAILPGALRFAWAALTAESTLDGCTLDIVHAPGAELVVRRLEVTRGR